MFKILKTRKISQSETITKKEQTPKNQKKRNADSEAFADSVSLHGVHGLVHSPYIAVKLIWIGCLVVALAFGVREIYTTGSEYAKSPVIHQVETSELGAVPAITLCVSTGAAHYMHYHYWVEKPRENCTDQNPSGVDEAMLTEWYLENHRLHQFSYVSDPKAIRQGFDHLFESSGFEPGLCSRPIPPGKHLNASLDLQVLYDTYLGGYPVSPCTKRAYEETFLAYTYDKIVVSESWFSHIPDEYIMYTDSSLIDYAWPTNSSEKFLDDMGSGICTTYEFAGQTLGHHRAIHIKPKAEYYGFFVNGIRLNEEYLHLGVWENHLYKLDVQATKFKRVKNCEKNPRESPEIARKKCLSREMWHNIGCCFCGDSGADCPTNARCCQREHICEAFRNASFEDAWVSCGHVTPPCTETSYSTSITNGFYKDPNAGEMHGDNPTIRIHFKNPQATLTITEIPRFTFEELLGNIGGILGLFMGGSLLSAVEITIFCILWLQAKVSVRSSG